MMIVVDGRVKRNEPANIPSAADVLPRKRE